MRRGKLCCGLADNYSHPLPSRGFSWTEDSIKQTVGKYIAGEWNSMKVKTTNNQIDKQSKCTLLVAYGILLWGMHRNNRETKSASLKLQLMTVFVATGAEFGVDS